MSIKVALLLSVLLSSSVALCQQPPTQIPPASSTIVVLGSPDPITQGESSRAVVALDTSQEPSLQDVEDYLRTDSSVDIQQRGASGVQADISIRGGSFEQTLVLVNGLRINDAETSTSISISQCPSMP